MFLFFFFFFFFFFENQCKYLYKKLSINKAVTLHQIRHVSFHVCSLEVLWAPLFIENLKTYILVYQFNLSWCEQVTKIYVAFSPNWTVPSWSQIFIPDIKVTRVKNMYSQRKNFISIWLSQCQLMCFGFQQIVSFTQI